MHDATASCCRFMLPVEFPEILKFAAAGNQMRRPLILATTCLISVGCVNTWAADPSPQPTTSPTNSGKIHLKPASNADQAQFVKARSAISASIAEFQATVSKGKSRVNAKELEALTHEINRQANIIRRYAKTANNTAAEKLAAQLIIDDDVTGRKPAQQATARRLMELDAKLGLLEPVVHR